ncbi:AAA family ATPase [Microbacterium enclense]|uniref:AAA family ATPase n=1 Tax=Microbacterium enclense TaxID=993073 RepID=UPI002041CEDC|nr:AAA family ATPase [Microbacterium enclense]MCM3615897.1 AAA family ATPase [Microbacterium enclense]
MGRGDDWLHDPRPIQRIKIFSDAAIDPGAWPADIPAVRQFLDVAGGDGWEVGAGVTFLVGENGSGKSTLIEGIAEAYGLPAEGGSSNGGGETRRTESPLSEWLRIERSPRAPRWGFFLRAETMHSYYSWRDDLPPDGRSSPPSLHPMSHGESFNALLDEALDHPQYVAGLACLDEPEAALSFSSTLRWLASLDRMRSRGTQVICATHSPVLAALPGATILELGDWGIRESTWEDLEVVRLHRSFLDAPERFLRHLLD